MITFLPTSTVSPPKALSAKNGIWRENVRRRSGCSKVAVRGGIVVIKSGFGLRLDDQLDAGMNFDAGHMAPQIRL